MNTQQQNVFDQAMALTPDQRADLIDSLLDTLDTRADPAVEAAWATEAEDRLAAYRRGELKAVEFDQAMERLGNRGQ
jgi:putative addiction module component (TIGR02574 family)